MLTSVLSELTYASSIFDALLIWDRSEICGTDCMTTRESCDNRMSASETTYIMSGWALNSAHSHLLDGRMLLAFETLCFFAETVVASCRFSRVLPNLRNTNWHELCAALRCSRISILTSQRGWSSATPSLSPASYRCLTLQYEVEPIPLGTGSTCPHFYNWPGTGAPWVEANQKLTKLYWPSQKRSPKRLIVLV